MLGVRVVGIRELEMEDWAGEVRLISVQSFGVWYGCPPQRPTANKLRSIRCAGELVFSVEYGVRGHLDLIAGRRPSINSLDSIHYCSTFFDRDARFITHVGEVSFINDVDKSSMLTISEPRSFRSNASVRSAILSRVRKLQW